MIFPIGLPIRLQRMHGNCLMQEIHNAFLSAVSNLHSWPHVEHGFKVKRRAAQVGQYPCPKYFLL